MILRRIQAMLQGLLEVVMTFIKERERNILIRKAAACLPSVRRSKKRAEQVAAFEEDEKTLALFLNFAMKDIHDNPSSLEPYTEEMAAEDDELLAGVEVDW